MLFKHKQFPLALYCIVWLLCIGYFWAFVYGDALGYAVLVFFLILPLAALIASLLMGLYKGWGKRTWFFPLVLSAGHLLADYFTFKLASTISHHKFNPPDWSLLLPGLVCGLAGMILSCIISDHLRKKRELT